jgi:hypothetical protein
MPVELTIVESVTALETTVVEVILESSSTPGPAGPGVPTGGTVSQVLTKDSSTDYDTSWQDPTGGPGGGVTDADYLVGTAHPDLSAEIVVGTEPGGELGGTWASPTVDATHSGSSHAGVQAAAEATAAAALSAHEADTTGVHGIADTSALALTANHPTNATFNDHSARHENGGADEISIAGLDGTPVELMNHLNDAADAHDASAISVLDTGTFYTATDVEGVLAEIAPQLGGGSGEAMQREITQTTHGLAVGDIVRLNGSTWQKAQANSAANAEALGIVADVPDANTFVLHYGGRITGLSGLSAGTVYYLDDDTAGLLTATEPPDAGDVSKPLLVADSTTTGYFFNWRGALNVDMATQAELDAHISDSSDAHDASAISVADSGAFYTATDVEGVLAEIAPQLGGGGLTVVETLTAGAGGSATFDFQSIPQTGQAIQITFSIRSEAAVANEGCGMRFNNDSGGNYDWTRLDGQGSTVAGAGFAAQTSGQVSEVIGANVADRVGAGVIFIPAYASTAFFHAYRADSMYSLDTQAGNQGVRQIGGTWRSTAAITRVTLFCASGDMAEGSTATLCVIG